MTARSRPCARMAQFRWRNRTSRSSPAATPSIRCGGSRAIHGISHARPAAHRAAPRRRSQQARCGSPMAPAWADLCAYPRASAALSDCGRVRASCPVEMDCRPSTTCGSTARWRATCRMSHSCSMPWPHSHRTILSRAPCRSTVSRRLCGMRDPRDAQPSAPISACAALIRTSRASLAPVYIASPKWVACSTKPHRFFLRHRLFSSAARAPSRRGAR